MTPNPRYRRNKNRGFSLVEIMVGLVIGMLGILVIMQVFTLSEGRKRTTTNSNDAQENGLSAILAIERDVRQAGYGYTSSPGLGSNLALGCNQVIAYNQNANPTNIQFRLIPILITDGGPGLSDSITVAYSTANSIVTPVTVTQSAAPSAEYTLTNNADKAGFTTGDLVLAVDPGPPQKCGLAQITGLTGAGNVITHNPGAGGDYNAPAGLGITASQLINLGNPAIVRYFIPAAPNYNLSIADLKLGTTGGVTNALTLADNIVNIQAQYGIDTNNDGSVDSWVEPTGATWGDDGATTPNKDSIAQIKAVRVAVVARSALMEKVDPATGSCTTTTTAPTTWAGGPTVNLSADANWQCYRYKVYQTIIPLRNMIWSES